MTGGIPQVLWRDGQESTGTFWPGRSRVLLGMQAAAAHQRVGLKSPMNVWALAKIVAFQTSNAHRQVKSLYAKHASTWLLRSGVAVDSVGRSP